MKSDMRERIVKEANQELNAIEKSEEEFGEHELLKYVAVSEGIAEDIQSEITFLEGRLEELEDLKAEAQGIKGRAKREARRRGLDFGKIKGIIVSF